MKENNNKTILVTGGAGFIGSHIVDFTLGDKSWNKVICVDNLSADYGTSNSEENIAHNLKNPRFVFYKADIKDEKKIEEIFSREKPVAVVHLAAKADTRNAVEAPQEYIDTNITGTKNILEASKNNGVKKLVLFSSSSVYGNKNKAPFIEAATADFPISPYGATKKSMEILAHTYHHNFGLNIVCLRIFNAFGERMRPSLVLYKWVKAILKNETIEMSGKGTRKRDFTYVGDIVSAVDKSIKKNIGFEVLNIGNANPIALKDLLKSIEKVLGKKADVKSRPSNHASVEKTHANISKAKKILGWTPKTSFEKGIRKFVDWYKKYRNN